MEELLNAPTIRFTSVTDLNDYPDNNPNEFTNKYQANVNATNVTALALTELTITPKAPPVSFTVIAHNLIGGNAKVRLDTNDGPGITTATEGRMTLDARRMDVLQSIWDQLEAGGLENLPSTDVFLARLNSDISKFRGLGVEQLAFKRQGEPWNDLPMVTIDTMAPTSVYNLPSNTHMVEYLKCDSPTPAPPFSIQTLRSYTPTQDATNPLNPQNYVEWARVHGQPTPLGQISVTWKNENTGAQFVNLYTLQCTPYTPFNTGYSMFIDWGLNYFVPGSDPITAFYPAFFRVPQELSVEDITQRSVQYRLDNSVVPYNLVPQPTDAAVYTNTVIKNGWSSNAMTDDTKYGFDVVATLEPPPTSLSTFAYPPRKRYIPIECRSTTKRFKTMTGLGAGREEFAGTSPYFLQIISPQLVTDRLAGGDVAPALKLVYVPDINEERVYVKIPIEQIQWVPFRTNDIAEITMQIFDGSGMPHPKFAEGEWIVTLSCKTR